MIPPLGEVNPAIVVVVALGDDDDDEEEDEIWCGERDKVVFQLRNLNIINKNAINRSKNRSKNRLLYLHLTLNMQGKIEDTILKNEQMFQLANVESNTQEYILGLKLLATNIRYVIFLGEGLQY